MVKIKIKTNKKRIFEALSSKSVDYEARLKTPEERQASIANIMGKILKKKKVDIKKLFGDGGFGAVDNQRIPLAKMMEEVTVNVTNTQTGEKHQETCVPGEIAAFCDKARTAALATADLGPIISRYPKPIIWTWGVDTAAADGISIFFNPIFAQQLIYKGKNLTKKEQSEGKIMSSTEVSIRVARYFLYVLVHESYHQLYQHRIRAERKQETAGGHNHNLANIAMDVEINRDIEKQLPTRFAGATNACNGCFDSTFKSDAWEEIFDAYFYGKKTPPQVNQNNVNMRNAQQDGSDQSQQSQQQQGDQSQQSQQQSVQSQQSQQQQGGQQQQSQQQGGQSRQNQQQQGGQQQQGQMQIDDTDLSKADQDTLDELGIDHSDKSDEWQDIYEDELQKQLDKALGKNNKNSNQNNQNDTNASQANDAAQRAQDAANRAQEAAQNGDEEGAKQAAQEAAQAAQEAAQAAQNAAQNAQQNPNGQKSDQASQNAQNASDNANQSAENAENAANDNSSSGQDAADAAQQAADAAQQAADAAQQADNNSSNGGQQNGNSSMQSNQQGGDPGMQSNQSGGDPGMGNNSGMSGQQGGDSDMQSNQPGGDPGMGNPSGKSGQQGVNSQIERDARQQAQNDVKELINKLQDQIEQERLQGIPNETMVSKDPGKNAVFNTDTSTTFGGADNITKELGAALAAQAGKPYTGAELSQDVDQLNRDYLEKNKDALSNISEDLKNKLEDIANKLKHIKPLVNWKKQLHDFFKDAMKSSTEPARSKRVMSQDGSDGGMDRDDKYVEYRDVDFIENNAANVFYLIDNSGSMYCNGDGIFLQIFKDIVTLEKRCKILNSARAYFTTGSIKPKEVEMWNYKTKEKDILDLLSERGGSGGTDIPGNVVSVTKLKKPYYYNNGKHHTLIIVFTDGYDSGFELLQKIPTKIRKQVLFVIMEPDNNSVINKCREIHELGKIPTKNLIGINTSGYHKK